MNRTKKQLGSKHLADYESLTNQLMDQISRRDARLEWLKDEHERLTQQIADKERAVLALTTELEAITGSRGWRLVLFLRKAKGLFRGRAER
jgi:uncharacterized protein YdcH (DUF465 family)